MGFLAWIILGLIVGAIVKAVMPGRVGGGWVTSLILGVVGAIVGGWIGSLLWASSTSALGFSLSSVASLSPASTDSSPDAGKLPAHPDQSVTT
jgi:uncharacterized membrane protein YeaQ/YmgE (transglycosylase-associated protein family)